MGTRELETRVLPQERALGLLREIRGRGTLGSPLYTYRATTEEIDALVTFVRRGIDLRRIGSHEASAYCIIAAHVLCKSYSGGFWKWEPVDELVGTPSSREHIIGKGLQLWGREVVRCGTHRQWLYTLASEGGLPLGMLAAEGNRFDSFFRGLLAQAETFADVPLERLVSSAIEQLPTSLQNDAVSSLAVDLVGRIREFRAITGDGPTKLEALERERPQWRNELPVDVGDNVARRLIEGLLLLPVERKKTGAIRAVRVSTTLIEHEQGQFSIEHSLEIPLRVEQSDLVRQLGLIVPDGEDVPVRFRVSCLHMDGTLEPLFHVSHGSRSGTYSLEPFGASRRKVLRQGTQSVRLQAHHEGEALGPPVRVSEDLGPMPWVFSDDEFKLLAVGPCATTREFVIVAFEKGKCIELTSESRSGNGELDRVGEITGEEREIWLLSGDAVVEHEGEKYSIKTSAETEQSQSIRMRGESVAFLSGSAWLGCPDIYREDGPLEVPVVSSDVQWRRKGDSGEWFRLSTQCRGDVQLRVKVGGLVVHKSSETVLPEKFSFRLVPGRRTGEGGVELIGLESARVGVPPSEGRTAEVETSLDKVRVQVSAQEGFEFHDLPLALDWGNLRTDIRVSYPGSFVGFVGPGGVPLKRESVVAVDRLFGVCARALTSNVRAEYLLIARLKGREFNLAKLKSRSSGEQEIVLEHVQDRIEALLCGGLDTQVELFVAENGGVVGSARREAIRVHWYDAHLVPSKINREGESVDRGLPPTNCWQLTCPESEALGANLRCEVHRLDDPQREGKFVLLANEKGWIFDGTERAPGPWLVSAWKGAALVARPLMLTVWELDSLGSEEERLEEIKARALSAFDEEQVAESDVDLSTAIACPEKYRRRKALAAVVRQLSKDAAHSDWPRSLAYVASMNEFPADTYELVRNIAYNSDALALTMLKLAGSRFSAAWDKFEDFEFIWPTFPIDSWVNALNVYCGTQFGDQAEQLLPLVLQNLRNDLTANKSLSGAWAVILEYISKRVAMFPSPEQSLINISPLLEGQVRAHVQRVGQLHAGEDWPSFEWKDLVRRDALDWSRVFELIPTSGQSYRAPVLAAPAVAAAISVAALQPSPEALLELRYARSFDQHYFDFAYSYALARLLKEKLEQ